ncbi:phage protein NinX family protein [Pseudomonas guariconensis]|uniref:phage protein NinX family protein n=1 Tax=Pseudomonas guariconensis TaxID=1288410 RepID=UPI00300CC4D5
MTDLIEVRVSNLLGAALDWAVAMAEGFKSDPERLTNVWLNEEDLTSVSIRGVEMGYGFRPSSNWEHGGQLIDKHSGTAQHIPGLPADLCYAGGPTGAGVWCYGPTALIAFCRGLVNHKLGDTVQVPKELMP